MGKQKQVKLSKPHLPSEPHPPRKPDETVRVNRTLCKDYLVSSSVCVDVTGYDGRFEYVQMPFNEVENIANEMRKLISDVPGAHPESIFVQIRGYSYTIHYEETIPNPNLKRQLARYEKMLKSHAFDMKIYRERMATYERDMEQYQLWSDAQELERAKNLLKKHGLTVVKETVE